MRRSRTLGGLVARQQVGRRPGERDLAGSVRAVGAGARRGPGTDAARAGAADAGAAARRWRRGRCTSPRRWRPSRSPARARPAARRARSARSARSSRARARRACARRRRARTSRCRPRSRRSPCRRRRRPGPRRPLRRLPCRARVRTSASSGSGPSRTSHQEDGIALADDGDDHVVAADARLTRRQHVRHAGVHGAHVGRAREQDGHLLAAPFLDLVRPRQLAGAVQRRGGAEVPVGPGVAAVRPHGGDSGVIGHVVGVADAHAGDVGDRIGRPRRRAVLARSRGRVRAPVEASRQLARALG